jgi:hypothetical protein
VLGKRRVPLLLENLQQGLPDQSSNNHVEISANYADNRT